MCIMGLHSGDPTVRKLTSPGLVGFDFGLVEIQSGLKTAEMIWL